MARTGRPGTGRPGPWRPGNAFTLLVDGGRYFPAMLEAIEAASETVLLEMYLVESGRVASHFIAALGRAAARGVDVRLLLDGFGCRQLGRRDRQRLKDAGVRLAIYNPLRYGQWRRNLFRDHRKLLVVDGRCAFVGGAGITDAFDPEAGGERYWHDAMLRVEGPVVADWLALFQANWRHWSSAPCPPPTAPAGAAGSARGRVVAGGTGRDPVLGSLTAHIRGADRRVRLATAYFVPPMRLRRALRLAARTGADVRLLLPGPHTDHPWVRHIGRRFYGRLLANGVRIFEYQPRFLHLKAVVCDDWLSIGSANLDRWNHRWSLEANQEVADRAAADALAETLEADMAEATEITLAAWQRRGWRQRLIEWWWGRLVVRLLERLSEGPPPPP